MQHSEAVPPGLGHGTDFLDDSVFARSKTSLRMHYEAQVVVIQRQSGDLEKIRTDLGLSNRKICQLLMVDPSSWTRWTRQGDQAPPHIWRALQWYLILREKIPGLTPQYFVGQDPKTLHQKALQKIDEEKLARLKSDSDLSDQLINLEKKMQFYRIFLGIFIATSLLLSVIFVMKSF